MTKRPRILIALLIIATAALALKLLAPDWLVSRMTGKKTVEDRLAQYGPEAHARLEPYFNDAGVPYPPARLVMAGFKKEKQLHIYASSKDMPLRFIRSYPILASSGTVGPKLKYGDCQVPEGIYPLTFLNPNSRYHLSIRVGYPNSFDREMAEQENRDNLGGDIMIHGKSVSIGCLAMGDEASEDLFVLTADTGLANTKLILSPTDFRSTPHPTLPSAPKWLPTLYKSIKAELNALPKPSPRR